MKVSPNPKGNVAGSLGADATSSIAQSGKTKTNKNATAAGEGAAPTSEKVNLSQKVMDMQKAKELATPSSVIDEAKVARLQKLIDDGEYKMDADAIADRLVDDHLNIPT